MGKQSDGQPINTEIIVYQSDGSNIPIEVYYEDETLWASQQIMADLFGVNVRTISEHLSNIFETGELDEAQVINSSGISGRIGSTGRGRPPLYYSLDAVIAVGYRVNSMRATRFRQWATATLKEYITKGFVLNDDMLKNGAAFGKDYFDELLARIRDIRASERRFYQKITDIFQECSFDYDKSSEIARAFYAECQNKLHFAVTGKTAAELIMARADASKPNMGLTSWKGGPKGRIHSSDVEVAKNYLSEDEISQLNTVVSMLLDAVELRARQGRLTSMEECIKLIDKFIQFNEMELLEGKGKRSMTQAKRKAKKEFDTFQKIQDHSYMNDFEREMKRIEEAGVMSK